MRDFLKDLHDLPPEELHRQASMHLRALSEHLDDQHWHYAREMANAALKKQGEDPLPKRIEDMSLNQVGRLGLSAAIIKESLRPR